jgi:hypothetical protein
LPENTARWQGSFHPRVRFWISRHGQRPALWQFERSDERRRKLVDALEIVISVVVAAAVLSARALSREL